MLRYWVAVLAVFIALTGNAEAAELEGFGSIKFGMSKEEAWAAIDGKGEWANPDVLNYFYDFDKRKRVKHLEVNQEFEEGRAGNATVDFLSVGPASYACSSDGLRLADLIQHKYNLVPNVHYGLPHESRPGDRKSYIMEDSFHFVFDNKASIKITSTFYYASRICKTFIYYRVVTE